MKELVIISGKGGTGKTSITAAFAGLAKNAILADCDVDAADLHLILEPSIKETHDFSGGRQAKIITEKCIGCGKCKSLCRFGAIQPDGDGKYKVDDVKCEGCKVCVEFCPVNAVEFNDAINGQWFVSKTKFGTMVHAKLGIAEENSGKLVTLIRKKAKEIAEQQKNELLIIDGSPGIGCPVIASITGADLVMAVTEPTLSGLHDLQRVAELAANFKIKTLVCVNKADINPQITEEIKRFAAEKNLAVAGEIGYDNGFTEAQIKGKSIVEYDGKGETAEIIRKIWQKIETELQGNIQK